MDKTMGKAAEDKILLFIPMYNCEKQIPRVLAKIAALGKRQALFAGLIIIDNGSKDGSVEAARAALGGLSIPARILRNRQNLSLGGSHKVAFRYAEKHGYTHVVVLHGDDQGSIADLAPHLESGVFRQYDSFLGARFMKGARLEGYSRLRVWGNYALNAFASLVCLRPIYDLGSGLNLYATSYLRSGFYLPFKNGLTFNNYMVFYGVYARSRFAFFPIGWGEDDQVSNAKMFSQAMEILAIALKFRLRPKSIYGGRENEYSGMDYEGYEVVGEG